MDKGKIKIVNGSLISDPKKYANNIIAILDLAKIDFSNDDIWPRIVEVNLDSDNKNEEFRYSFWKELIKEFRDRQIKETVFFHKGQIYWNIALIELHRGDLKQSIKSFKLAYNEDKARSEGAPSAARSVLSIIEPLINRVKSSDEYSYNFKEDISSLKFYEDLSHDEKREFADYFTSRHNEVVRARVEYIKERFFDFIVDVERKKQFKLMYKETKNNLVLINNHSYYCSIFGIGSLLESMLDDLFDRDDINLWGKFIDHKSKLVKDKKIENGSIFLNSKNKYPYRATLSQKIFLFKLLNTEGIIKFPGYKILLMMIIAEYRDLIHPQRKNFFPYKVDRYSVVILFCFLSAIAHEMWSENFSNWV